MRKQLPTPPPSKLTCSLAQRKKWPAPKDCSPGPSYSARELVSRILFLCGHSSRRRVAADTHQRPTRRFRQLSTPSTKTCRWGPRSEPPGRIGPMRDASLALGPRTPSLFGLAPCGVYPAPGLTAGAVRSYRTFSPLPQHRHCRTGEPFRCSGDALIKRGSRGGIFSVALAVHEP